MPEETVQRTHTSDIAFTPTVKREQERHGSRAAYARMEQKSGWNDRVTDGLRDFLADVDSFYLGTANEEGQPYVQHRGGPPGFLRALDERTLAFADFAGNRQFITTGTLSENDRAFIFLMDYRNRRRIKVWGRARAVEGDDALMERLVDPAYPGRPERAIVFQIEAWDVNCPQHIPRRYSEADVEDFTQALRDRVAELETELESLRRAA
jgi:hypothetical protein